VAIVVLAWLAVMERDARLEQRGVAAAGLQTPAARARAERDFRSARLLNPDSGPDVSRAFVLQAEGRSAAAIRAIRGVLRREPDNLQAWAVLATFARGHDPAAVREAFAADRRLDPISAR
jgi:predicted Zn-dependent protease